MTTAHVVLRFERGRWRALGSGIDFEHAELRGLDAMLSRAFAAPARVHVRFDLEALPVWIRQYHAHYCNYVLHVDRQ